MLLPTTIGGATSPADLARMMLTIGCPEEMFDELLLGILRRANQYMSLGELWHELNPSGDSGTLWRICWGSVQRLEDGFRIQRESGKSPSWRWRALNVLESLAWASR